MKKILLAACMASTVQAAEQKANAFPDYYQAIEPIQLKDVMLSYFGSTPTGIVSYGLEDAGKTSGHICPAITGAFLMTREALRALAKYYKEHPSPDKITAYDPQSGLLYRGGIKVTMSGKADSGSAANAIAGVISHITGAKGASGFKGGPDFPFANRQNLLTYDDSLQFSPKDGIEVIFTGMTATYEKQDNNGKWQPTTYQACKGTWDDKCRETTQCDKSVKVTYHFKSPDIIGKTPQAPWAEKIKNILDNADKAITVEDIANPKAVCTKQ